MPSLTDLFRSYVTEPAQRTAQSVYDIGTSPLRGLGMLADTPVGKAVMGTDVTDPLGPSPGLGDVVPGLRGVRKLLPMLAALPGTPAAMRGAPLTKVMRGERPQRVFHGTPNAFQEFSAATPDPNALYGPGLYFTENPAVASDYAKAKGRISPKAWGLKQAPSGEWAWDWPEDVMAPNVRPAYLDITKPFDVDAPVDLAVVGLLQKHFPEHIVGQVRSNDDAYRALVALRGTPAAATRALQQFGYDGITHIGGKMSGGEPHRVWIAFKPEQIADPFQYESGQRPLDRLMSTR